ncbi:MAG: AMIN domain-containing protein [Gammaproteobacteria bacterium]
MSLVNDLLINLEERRGGQRTDKGVFAGLDSADDELTLRDESRVPDWIRRSILLVMLAAVFVLIWSFMKIPQTVATMPDQPAAVTIIDADTDAGKDDSNIAGSLQPQLRLADSLVNVPAPELPPTAVPAEPEIINKTPQLLNIDVNEGNDDVIVQLDLTAMPAYRHYQLASPDRLVLEFENATLADTFVNDTGYEFIKAVRHNAGTGNDADPFRLVFDLNSAVTIIDEQVLKDRNRSQLTLKLRPADAQAQKTNASTASVSSSDPDNSGANAEIVRKDDVSMQRRPAEQVRIKESAYQQALRYYQQADYAKTISTLDRHLEGEPDDAEAIHLQALALIKSGQQELADKRLYDVTRRLPESTELKQLYAHLLMQQNKLADAAAILYISPPVLTDAPDYHALLAAVLQQLDQHAEAAGLYAELVELAPTQGVWWMGLGISLEETGHADKAIMAYRRALDSGRLTADLTDYVAARIRTLSNRLSEPRNS